MRNFIFLVVALIGFIPFSAGAESPLNQYSWENRLWLLFADTPRHPSVQKAKLQISDLSGQLAERHMVVIAVYQDEVETLFSRTQAERLVETADLAKTLRSRFNVSNGEILSLLIGKDTGVKSKRTSLHNASELFQEIDRMPMRRQEIRRQSLQ